MNRSPLLLTNDVRFCVSGTVTIHPTAAIAANVILRATPGSCIVIGAGVVVGKGSVLQSYGGSLVVEDGVTLGSQVLLIGQGVIRKNACIGSLSTLMANITVTEGAMVPANSLVGAPEPQFVDTAGSSGVENAPQKTQDQTIEEGSDSGASENVDTTNVDTTSESTEQSEIPHPNSHRMFMPINTPRYSGGAVDEVNEGRELGKPSSAKANADSKLHEDLDSQSSEASSPLSSTAGTGDERASSSSAQQSAEEKHPNGENAQADENTLLALNWDCNTETTSNLKPEAGFVYVLIKE